MISTSLEASVSDTNVWQFALAQGRGVLQRDTDRALALLREGRIVNDQPGLGEQGLLQRHHVPNTAGDKVMKLVVTDATVARRHRLDALAIAGSDQPRHIGRTDPRPHLAPQCDEKGRKPALKIGLPVLVHGRPSRKPAIHESRKPRRGNPANPRRSKICQSSDRRSTAFKSQARSVRWNSPVSI
jgi:hypothetical protein